MKKVLLATTMLVAGASIAAAEVTLSGDARMGIVKSGKDNALTLSTDEGAATFTSRARVTFTMSAESDSGLSYGASFRADNAANAASGLAGSVFISGAFGKLSMGDVDGAAQTATGNVAQKSLTGLGDLSESTFLGAGGMTHPDAAGLTAAEKETLRVLGVSTNITNDPTLLYEYAAGAFTGYVSFTNPRDTIWLVPTDPDTPATPAEGSALLSNAEAWAVGGKYTFGDYAVGLGYEKLSGYVSATLDPTAMDTLDVATPDNTSLKHIVATVEGTVAGLSFKGLYGKASGKVAGLTLADLGLSGKQYAASVSYSTNGITGTAFYTDDSGVGGIAAYGLGASYDLGGGASIVGGVAKTKVNGPDSTSMDLGVTFTF